MNKFIARFDNVYYINNNVYNKLYKHTKRNYASVIDFIFLDDESHEFCDIQLF